VEQGLLEYGYVLQYSTVGDLIQLNVE
jgi:hypothetical protein